MWLETPMKIALEICFFHVPLKLQAYHHLNNLYKEKIGYWTKIVQYC